MQTFETGDVVAERGGESWVVVSRSYDRSRNDFLCKTNRGDGNQSRTTRRTFPAGGLTLVHRPSFDAGDVLLHDNREISVLADNGSRVAVRTPMGVTQIAKEDLVLENHHLQRA